MSKKVNIQMTNQEDDIQIEDENLIKKTGIKKGKNDKKSKFLELNDDDRHKLISCFSPPEIKDFPHRPIKTILIVSI
jgi:hypothetical protein